MWELAFRIPSPPFYDRIWHLQGNVYDNIHNHHRSERLFALTMALTALSYQALLQRTTSMGFIGAVTLGTWGQQCPLTPLIVRQEREPSPPPRERRRIWYSQKEKSCAFSLLEGKWVRGIVIYFPTLTDRFTSWFPPPLHFGALGQMPCPSYNLGSYS